MDLTLTLSASRKRHPGLIDAQHSRHRGDPEVDVTPLSGVRAPYGCLRSHGERREIASLGI
jgi:hypothetical protein